MMIFMFYQVEEFDMGNKLFGTDGVRGVANVYPMTAEFALKLGMAAGQLICRKTRRAAVARDTRISGEMLEAALTAGFNAAGVTVLKLGVVPTPAATMLTPSLGVDMTVMITASHNPYQDNGIKLINADGDKFSDAETARIEAAIAADDFKLNPDDINKKIKKRKFIRNKENDCCIIRTNAKFDISYNFFIHKLQSYK